MLTLGRTLLLWRDFRGFSQADLAKRAGIPRPNLSRIEGDRKDVLLQTIRALGTALNVSPGSLVDGVPPQGLGHEPKALSRQALENIAKCVASGGKLPNSKERAIVDRLRIVLAPRLRAVNPKYKGAGRIGRTSERAWLNLSFLPKAELDSLIQRVIEHAQVPNPKPH